MMGLAPYGSPIYVDLIKRYLIDIKQDGSFRLDQKYFDYSTGLKMTNSDFNKIFQNPPRRPEEEINQFHMDIAASIQKVLEDVILLLSKDIAEDFKLPNLCIAGGVALNCVANGKLAKSGLFKDIWIQPAAGDAGGAVGAAYSAWHQELGHQETPTLPDAMHGGFGPEYSDSEIRTVSR